MWYYPSLCLQQMRKTTNSYQMRWLSVPTKIQIGHLPNMSLNVFLPERTYSGMCKELWK
jgi:hypothetical protein